MEVYEIKIGCIRVYWCVFVNIIVYWCIFVCIHVYSCVFVFVRVYSCVLVCIRVCSCVGMCMRVYSRVFVRIRGYSCMFMYIGVYMCTFECISACLCVFVCNDREGGYSPAAPGQSPGPKRSAPATTTNVDCIIFCCRKKENKVKQIRFHLILSIRTLLNLYSDILPLSVSSDRTLLAWDVLPRA